MQLGYGTAQTLCTTRPQRVHGAQYDPWGAETVVTANCHSRKGGGGARPLKCMPAMEGQACAPYCSHGGQNAHWQEGGGPKEGILRG